MTADPYTMDAVLCDAQGMVSREQHPTFGGSFLDFVSHLRRLTPNVEKGATVTEPFVCTGSAHLAGEHIRCTSTAHEQSRAIAGLPEDLVRVLRDHSITVPKDQHVFELIGSWATPRPGGGGI